MVHLDEEGDSRIGQRMCCWESDVRETGNARDRTGGATLARAALVTDTGVTSLRRVVP